MGGLRACLSPRLSLLPIRGPLGKEGPSLRSLHDSLAPPSLLGYLFSSRRVFSLGCPLPTTSLSTRCIYFCIDSRQISQA